MYPFYEHTDNMTQLNNIMDSNSKYSLYMILQLKALNYKKFKIKLWIRNTFNYALVKFILM